MAARIAIVSAVSAFGQDADTPLLEDALGRRGARVEHLAWDDTTVSWGRFDAVLLRSPWDYTSRPRAFVDWARRCAAATRLFNGDEVLAWNADKRYLADLAGRGIATVPTAWAPPGEPPSLPATGEFVVKPAIGAGSRGARRFGPDQHEAALAHARAIGVDGVWVMVQPYLAGVDTRGERALVHFDGRFSHAVRKAAMLAKDGGATCSLKSPAMVAAAEATTGERDFAARVIAAAQAQLGLDRPPLYARVDLVPGRDGVFLLELELIEPSLFLDTDPASADRLADALLARLSA
ncbi:MAG: ATP-grasp domain-containing protein [Lysobacteraceae bacterium]